MNSRESQSITFMFALEVLDLTEIDVPTVKEINSNTLHIEES